LLKSKTKIKILNKIKGSSKNPVFYFAFVVVFLFGGICCSCDSFASLNGLNNNHIVFNSLSDVSENQNKDALFLSQQEGAPLETPDLKIIQDNTLGGIATPRVVSTKTLGDVFGKSSQSKKEVLDYIVQPGDTLQSIAESNEISLNTLLWANDLTSSSKIKVGQSLVILPIDGVLHFVKSGDTLGAVASKYKANLENVIAFNDLANQDDIYIGDILVVPGGVMPAKAAPIINNNSIPLANNFFIYPTNGKITQGLHYYNAIDVANKCGTPVYAAASGTVQRVKYGYNAGGGNLVTILHSNGIVTYYGHLQTIFVKSGDKVNVGDRIGLIGNTGYVVGATGCHLHFQVMGAQNPLVKYPVGSTINLK
jgi:murein DD-endopeptidase MepM/ murein hydrolase activator NlpD